MAKVIMIQGTMSNAGKSLLTAGLCRIFHQDGYRVAPFKSQNMALNSFITADGLEMGRAQVMQAEAAGMEPSVDMNPILLKPVNHTGSQVIVNGEVLGNMSARDYFAYKLQLVPQILNAFRRLEQQADIIVIEGAGSPAEINLKENDIVNMGLAEMVDAPVLLVGDIDLGGVFAQLLGTLMLLENQERNRVQGLIINKFRGDRSILDSGVTMLEERGGVPVVGVVPYMELSLDEEDSQSVRFDRKEEGLVDIAVIRYPRISNYTDLFVFEQLEQVSVRYVTCVEELHHPDLIVLPGSKNTMGDLKWMRQNGLEALIRKRVEKTPVFGICGGYQMLGNTIADPHGMEEGGSIPGMGLLPVETVLEETKTRTQVHGTFCRISGCMTGLTGCEWQGYEIHMGCTGIQGDAEALCVIENGETVNSTKTVNYMDGCQQGNVYGTYVHGIFDQSAVAQAVIQSLAKRKGVSVETDGLVTYRAYKEVQYDKLAEGLRSSLDMEKIYRMLREAAV